MAKINKKGTRTAKPSAIGFIRTATAPDTKTFEGAAAWSRDAKSDLFLLAVTNFYGEDTFYEKATDRNERFIELVHRVAGEDPAWLGSFLPWLRRDANIRTAAVVGAIEAARVMALSGQSGSQMGPARRVVGETLFRADEPAEAMSYWLQNYGKKMPAPIRRGMRDVVERLYTERNFIKWDSDRKPVRMADVVELTHPRVSDWRQERGALYKYMIDSRHRPTDVPEELTMIWYRQSLLKGIQNPKQRKQFLTEPNVGEILAEAGMTWEALSSSGPMDKAAWEAIIPAMGYMALLRNLRNFQEAGISDDFARYVAGRLADPEAVARSRQLPYRFLSAYLEATSPHWAVPLETALQHATRNIPTLPGSTLVLVDTSSSMRYPMGGGSVGASSKITRMMAGALFGVALAAKGERVDLYGYANGVFKHDLRKGAGVLRTAEAFVNRCGEVGHGTQTALSLRATWNGHHRVVIVTDEQTFGPGRGGGNVADQIPSAIPIYAFNTTGYAPAMMEATRTRHELGGLTDHTFGMIPLVEAGQAAKWPWEVAS